jgi:hypothetical protein
MRLYHDLRAIITRGGGYIMKREVGERSVQVQLPALLAGREYLRQPPEPERTGISVIVYGLACKVFRNDKHTYIP